MTNPFSRYPNLQGKLEQIKTLQLKHQQYLEVLMAPSSNFLLIDLFIIAFLKRSIDIMDGIVSAINKWNFTVAAPLLRIQLDSLLKIVYLVKCNNPNILITRMMNGEQLRKIKDEEGKRLTDERLRFYARDIFPRVDNVYSNLSELVHFSSKHYYQCISEIKDSENTITYFFGVGNPLWSEPDLDEFLDALSFITELLLSCVAQLIKRTTINR